MAEDCPSDCPSRTTETPSCLSTFVRLVKHKCYTIGDGIVNLYCALKDIASAIREYTDKVTEKGYASGIIHFTYTEAQTVDPNDEIEIQHAKTPFNYKILGIGVSTMNFNSCGGAYVGNSILEVKFWDYTSGVQVGNKLTLTASNLHAKDTDEGNAIDDNIYPGHIYGAKVKYLNEEGSTCALPDLDFFLIVSPIDVITEE